MAKIQLSREVLERTRDRSNLTEAERATVDRILSGKGKSSLSAGVHEYPLSFLKALLDDSRLTPNQRAVVSMHVFGMTGAAVDCAEIYNTPVSNAVEFGSTFVMLGGKVPNCEYFLNGRWYSITLSVQFVQDNEQIRGALLQGFLSVCEVMHGISRYVFQDLFLDEAGVPMPRTVLEILQQFGFRALQTSAGDFNLKLVRAERAAREQGKVVLITGPVVEYGRHAWWSGFQSRALGTPEVPRRAVVEPELEVAENQRSHYAPYSHNGLAISRLPFVRVFSLDTKSYAYADVDDVTLCDFDREAMSRLHLPPAMRTVLTQVFNTPVEGLFGDLIKGKHGGVVILACGKPGVGKTLTAEVYAEQTERPLYVLELGELGTTVAQVEDRLQRVFTRVARWNAVLQFDECEIFLARRGEDLERSAIVGSFLRLMDYYHGILFLTTNRWEVLDHAVLSRVMLKLDYPDLDAAARAAIWRTMLHSAGLELMDGTFEELAEAEINGRQIRNLTRLARILHPNGLVTLHQMRSVLIYGCSVKEE